MLKPKEKKIFRNVGGFQFYEVYLCQLLKEIDMKKLLCQVNGFLLSPATEICILPIICADLKRSSNLHMTIIE